MSGRIQRTQENGQLNDKKQKTEQVEKLAVINEEPVDHDTLTKLENATKADFRALFGIKDGISIEIEYKDGDWTPAVIDKTETGETHKFHDEDRDSENDSDYSVPNDDIDFVDVPVVQIFRHGEREPVGVCFVNKCLLYDTEKRDIFHWKMFGEEWEHDDEDENDDEDEVGKILEFTTMDELREEIKQFIPEVFVNVAQENKEVFESLPSATQQIMTDEILKIKDAIIEKIVNFFVENGSLTPGTLIVLDVKEMKRLCDDVVREIYNNSI